MGMYFPDEATAPAVGCSRYTRSASTFCRKMKIVSSAKLPAPSVARPMMRMMPPAPEPGPCGIRGSRLLPGVGRHQVVDDVWRDQNQEIAPVLVLLAESEQLANDRQVYKERDSGLAHRDRGHREATDDRRFAVVDED